MSLGPKKTENDSKIDQSKTLKKKPPWKQKLFSFMSRLWSECADNKLIFNLERKADKFPKSKLRLSLA